MWFIIISGFIPNTFDNFGVYPPNVKKYRGCGWHWLNRRKKGVGGWRLEGGRGWHQGPGLAINEETKGLNREHVC